MTIEEKSENLLNEQKKLVEKMKLHPKLYAIKDVKTGKFAPPFTAPNNDIAKRMLHATVMDENSQIAKFAEDFQMFKLGSYDEETGELTNENEFIANAIEFKKE